MNPADEDALATRFWFENPSLRWHPLTVVIAAYNEEPSIGAVLAKVPTEVCGLPASVLVVADGCTDRTVDVALTSGVSVCALPVNCGQGAAFRVGYRLAREGGARFIATLDADGQFDPGDLGAVVAPLVDGSADFVSGSRRLSPGRRPRTLRELGVVVFGAVLSAVARQRITDPANGLRAMRAEITGAISLRQPQYQTAEVLIGVARAGYRLREVPATMVPRTAGRSKKGSDLLYGFRFLRTIVMTWHHVATVGLTESSATTAGRSVT
jgi:hypothetical protein